jgi:hypothetical protein
MTSYEDGCRGIDNLVNDYKVLAKYEGRRDKLRDAMYNYVNSLQGEAGLHKQKMIQDYFRRTELADKVLATSKTITAHASKIDNK